jgi:hypothetical protein
MKGDPLLKNLEGDPRYRAFLRKIKLPIESRNEKPRSIAHFRATPRGLSVRRLAEWSLRAGRCHDLA